MSLSKGTATCRIYHVDASEAPASLCRTATMAVRRYAFRPIDSERGEDQSFGWINPRSPLNMELVWEEMLDGNIAFLAVRIDRKAIDKVAFAARQKAMHAKVCSEKGIARLTRQHRLAIDEQLKVEMLKEVTPTTSYVEIVWDRGRSLLIIGTNSNATCERIVDLFSSSFDLRPAPQFPSLLGYAWSRGQGLDNAGAELPVLEIMERYGHFGPDFLTWMLCCWISGEEQPTPSEPGLQIKFASSITMSAVSSEAEKVSLAGESAADSPELRTALREGKRVAKAALVLTAHDNDWKFILDAETFGFGSATLPVPKIPDANEYLSLRIDAIVHLRNIVHELFDAFMAIRTNPDSWKVVVESWSDIGGDQ